MTLGISQNISTCIVNNDTMILITPAQLKTANLIFNEHSSLVVTDSLLTLQVKRYQNLYKDELVIDSLYESTISQLGIIINDCNNIIAKQQKSLIKSKKNLKSWQIGGISTSIILLLICLL